jgi:serine/threonine-protein kinase
MAVALRLGVILRTARGGIMMIAGAPVRVSAPWFGGDSNPSSATGAPGTEDPLLSSLETTAVIDPGPIPLPDAKVDSALHCKLGPYVLKKQLGAGGMGEVYLAEHTLLRRPCAIKLIRPENAGASGNLRSFEREVRATASLTNWNTIQIYDYGHAEDGTFYYVMEYLEGLNLQDLVGRHGPLAPARAIHFLRQVCSGLREAHGIGLIHCDIKPANIVACERGGLHDVAKLLDFGIVRTIRSSRDADQRQWIIGSPLYMSPEQATGKDRVDPRSDLYSLGAVAYFLLTGRPPFLCRSIMRTLVAHVQDPVPRPSRIRPGIPGDLEEIVVRCLSKQVTGRFENAESLEKALAACADAGAWTEEAAADWWQQHAGARARS